MVVKTIVNKDGLILLIKKEGEFYTGYLKSALDIDIQITPHHVNMSDCEERIAANDHAMWD